MDPNFLTWLDIHQKNQTTRQNSVAFVRRIETHYGDLDEHYERDALESVLSELEYSAIDERNNEPNPSRLEINGNIRNSLASHKSRLNQYIRFKEDADFDATARTLPEEDAEDAAESPLTFGLEKDMQAALRANIEQLETGLEIIDGGAERHVASGFIDILARDAQGQTVVIELKAVKAPLKAQAQIASYMGDIMVDTGTLPRGILVAPDFDAKLISAARVMPSLSLTRYRYSFSFEPVA